MSTYQANRQERSFDVSYAAFTSAFEGLLGRVDIAGLTEITTIGADAARAKLASMLGPLDFALFQKIDHGAVLRALTAKPAGAITYVFGNALIAFEMTKRDPRAGLYVPLRLLAQDIGPERVLVTYDLPSASLRQFASAAIDEVARSLDDKIERLLAETIERARS